MSQTPPAAPEENPQPRFELLQADDYGKYLLHGRKEILFLLRAMRDKGTLLTVHFDQGREFFLTTLLEVDEDALLIEPGRDAELNRRALASGRLIFVATHEKVKVQFSVPGLEAVATATGQAYRAPLPTEVLRLQRREYYRLTAPIAHPLRCIIPLRLADGSRTQIETTVIDISGGGLAVMAPPEGVEFETDHLFENCRIDLPEVGTVIATLRVRNVFEFTQRNGARYKRAGCQFVDLPGSMSTLIQRYIIRVERERKARESGMR